MAIVIHVSVHGSDDAAGTADAPLRTIDRAAQLARPGDTVTVHAGTYREWVRPRRGGRSDERRITYQAAPGEHVRITGSEQVTGWEPVGGGVWRVEVPNTLFGEVNPFAVEVDGDWIVRPGRDDPKKHLGAVYLDGRRLLEVASVDAVASAPRRTELVDDWTGTTVAVPDPDRTQRVWHAEVGADVTTIHAGFGDADPNTALVEVNVRRAVFFPEDHHVDFITVRGFELAQAATQWAPPTADQPGLIGPNWARGWVIEDNDIHDATCSAVSLGKEASTGDNFASDRGDKPGYQYQLESVFSARQIGWDREHIGSHVVRRNHIHHCGQNAVVGHLGCVFSRIEDNHIHDIANDREFYGHEIAGIKLHAPIDVVIAGNRIHDCSLGIWLDWQTQGTRITRNVLWDNSRDLFIEVSHGPYVVDHNVLTSPVSVENHSQGGAYVRNLLCGTVGLKQMLDRATPYHRPHSTQVAGYALILTGDDRWIGNVFAAGDLDAAYAPESWGRIGSQTGTSAYDGYPTSLEQYLTEMGDRWDGDHNRFGSRVQPYWSRGNVFVGGARPADVESEPLVLDGPARVEVVAQGDEVWLEVDVPGADAAVLDVVTGADLPPTRLVGADFEAPDGSALRIDTDLVGDALDGPRPAGPLAGGLSGVRVRLA
ncbi:right-handed parallel beta-helix repeat-containing protein [Cellulomonas sp. 179-A 9B4 NHS]|uniref:right-handed parallel beta-helix repeat-containing protein n=1 Tax=Cellulomonas sp. 179-A 9B4 NHS TaxID=3142379 RepID=UPI0039A12742